MLSLLSFSIGPTVRLFGPALQVLNIVFGLHSVARVPFFPYEIVSAPIYLVSLGIHAHSGNALRVFVCLLPLIYRRYIPDLKLARL